MNVSLRIAAAALLLASPACINVTGTDSVRLDASQIVEGSGRDYCYRGAEGRKLRFVLARDSHGKLHTLIDACQLCYQYHHGYEISGDELICRVCGNRYRLEHLERGIASCVPIGLAHEEKGNQVTVKVSDLTAANGFF